MKQTTLTILIVLCSTAFIHAQNTDYKNFLKNKTGITVNIGDTNLYLELQYVEDKGFEIAKKGEKKYYKAETQLDTFLCKEFPNQKEKQALVKQLILSELDLKAQKKEYELKLKNEKNKGKDRIAVIKPVAFSVNIYTDKRKGMLLKPKTWFRRNIKKALKNKDSTGYIKIDSVQIAFSDGFIKDMTAIGTLNEKTVIFKNPSPIPVRYYRDIERINKDSWYALVCRDDSVTKLIKMNDIITYLPNYSSRCQSFYPNNSIISFDGESKAETIYQRPFMENFDIRLYTDIMGFNQGKPNGLVQAEGKAGFILLSDRPFRRTFSGSSNYNRIIFLTLHKIRLYTKYSQIGEGDKVLPLKNSFKFDGYAGDDTVRCATNFDLFRYSNLDIGFELDLLTILSQSIKFDIKLNAGVFATKIDSVYDQIGCEISY